MIDKEMIVHPNSQSRIRNNRSAGSNCSARSFPSRRDHRCRLLLPRRGKNRDQGACRYLSMVMDLSGLFSSRKRSTDVRGVPLLNRLKRSYEGIPQTHTRGITSTVLPLYRALGRIKSGSIGVHTRGMMMNLAYLVLRISNPNLLESVGI